MRQPTLRQIEAFKALFECGTVSKAAKSLNVSQPAVSKLLMHLEEDVGFSLFERGRGRIRVTDRGARLYDEIDRVFSGVNQIAQAVEEIRNEAGGRLRIGVMPGISPRYLSAAANRIREEAPDLQINFLFQSSEFVSDALLARRFDLGIVTQGVDHPNFDTHVIDDRPLVAVLPKGHRLEALDRFR
ncbi:LysR family transcriptional regulator [Phaeobacter sp. J2-8]|uniref:LysR family transcriptional regulator n=1 Tax=Phaeobacter sp. J2-8 TaxID=2931394 RepID=UPI002457802F|nr:LysR family transcriptional regulator [Phaeobacter sp. J2-8]